LYIPSIGFVTAVAFLIVMLSDKLFSGQSRQRWLKVLGVLVLVVLLGLQWMVVNYIERQWSVLQSRQDRTIYDNLIGFAKELGY
jgi:high-affinity Fe2+/Pb2+ permease